MKPVDLVVMPAALVAGIAASVPVFASDRTEDPVRTGVLTLVIGWSFIGAGLVASRRRPENRTGAVMMATGFLWFLAQLWYGDSELAHTIGLAVESLFLLGFAYLLLTFPEGRLRSTLERTLIAIGLFTVTVPQVVWMLFDGEPSGCPRCSDNLLAVTHEPDVVDAIVNAQRTVGVALSAITVALLVHRWRGASVPARRAVAPVL